MAIRGTSILHKPSEYIAPIDLNAYYEIMKIQQNKVDNNIQSVAKNYQSILSADVLANKDRELLNNLAQQSVNQVLQMGNMDFTDSSVAMQANGIINSVTKDPRIHNALVGTAAARALQKSEAEARAKHPELVSSANSFFDNKAISDWTAAREAGEDVKYSGPTNYTKYVDYHKKANAAIKQLTASGSYQIVPGQYTKEGYPTMINTITKEEVKPETIRAAISSQLGADEIAQIQRDGNYTYMGTPLGTMQEQYKTNIQNQVGSITSKIKEIEAARDATQSIEKKQEYNNLISQYDEQISGLVAEDSKVKNRTKSDLSTELFFNKLINGYTSAFAYTKVKVQSRVNPEYSLYGQRQLLDDRQRFDQANRNSLTEYQRQSLAIQQQRADQAGLNADGTKKTGNSSGEGGLDVSANAAATFGSTDQGRTFTTIEELSADADRVNTQLVNTQAQIVGRFGTQGEHYTVQNGNTVMTEQGKVLAKAYMKKFDDMANGIKPEAPLNKQEMEAANQYYSIKASVQNSEAKVKELKDAARKELNITPALQDSWDRGKKLGEAVNSMPGETLPQRVAARFGLVSTFNKQQKADYDYYTMNQDLESDIADVANKKLEAGAYKLNPAIVPLTDKQIKTSNVSQIAIAKLTSGALETSWDIENGEWMKEPAKGIVSSDIQDVSILSDGHFGDKKGTFLVVSVNEKGDDGKVTGVRRFAVQYDTMMQRSMPQLNSLVNSPVAAVAASNTPVEYRNVGHNAAFDFVLEPLPFGEAGGEIKVQVKTPMLDKDGKPTGKIAMTYIGSYPPAVANALVTQTGMMYDNELKNDPTLTPTRFIDNKLRKAVDNL